jgi:hypothetical protein
MCKFEEVYAELMKPTALGPRALLCCPSGMKLKKDNTKSQVRDYTHDWEVADVNAA